MDKLTPRQQSVLDIWNDNDTVKGVARELGITPDFVGSLGTQIRKAGYELPHKGGKIYDVEEVRDSVKQVQAEFNRLGECDAFKHSLRRIWRAFGFKSAQQYGNRVRSLMSKEKILGGYSGYIRGQVSGHVYFGIQARDLIRQKWDRGLKL